MLDYARIGLEEWKTADPGLKNRASKCLGNFLADHPGEAGTSLNAWGRDAERLKFIPMPTRNVSRDIDRGFFVPIRGREGAKLVLSIEIVLLVRRDHCLGLRLEPAHAAGQSHDYGHVQMSRELLGLPIPTPDWIPVTYPAFPSSTSDPFDMFLFMMTAIHGHSGQGGVLEILTEILQTRPLDFVESVGRLRKLLGLA